MKRLILSLTVALAAGATQAHAGTIAYDPGLDTLPDAQGWTRFEGGPTQPGPSVTSGVLHQGPTDVSGYQYWQSTAASFDFTTSAVVVDFRMQVIESSYNAYPRGGYTVFLSDAGGRFAALYLTSGSVFLGNDVNNSVSAIMPFDTTDGYHDYQLTIDATGSALAIDGNPIVSLGLGGSTSSEHLIVFGDGTVLGNSETNLTRFSVSGVTITAVPEPASLTVLGVSLGGLAALRRRRAPG